MSTKRLAQMRFARGFLFAVNLKQRYIPLNPQTRLHRAFGKALAVAKENIPETEFEFLSGATPHPLFGVYQEALDVLNEGDADRLLDFTGDRAYFSMEADFAKKELKKEPQAEWFKKIAEVFVREVMAPLQEWESYS